MHGTVSHVDSALVEFHRYDDSHSTESPRDPELRDDVFNLIDAAFSQRRKTLRAVLKKTVSDEAFESAQIDSTRRGETLTIDDFIRLASASRMFHVRHS